MKQDTDAVLEFASALVDQARHLLGDQLEAVDEETGRLQRAHGHLNGTGKKPATPGRRASSRQPAKPKERWEEEIVAELREAPGTIGDLTLRLGLPKGSTTLFAPAKSALGKGLVEKDGSVYSVVEKPKPKSRRRRGDQTRSAAKATTTASKSK